MLNPFPTGPDQKASLQIEALKAYGCQEIFEEKLPGKSKNCAQLQRMLAQLQPGDQVVVGKLDQLSGSIKELVQLITMFHQLGVDFISLQDRFNTATVGGRLIFQVFAALSEFGRDTLRAGTRAWLSTARARCRKG